MKTRTLYVIILIIVAIQLATIGLVVAGPPSPSGNLELSGVTIVDDSAMARIKLEMHNGHPTLGMFDADGTDIVQIGPIDGGTELSLFNRDDQFVTLRIQGTDRSLVFGDGDSSEATLRLSAGSYDEAPALLTMGTPGDSTPISLGVLKDSESGSIKPMLTLESSQNTKAYFLMDDEGMNITIAKAGKKRTFYRIDITDDGLSITKIP